LVGTLWTWVVPAGGAEGEERVLPAGMPGKVSDGAQAFRRPQLEAALRDGGLALLGAHRPAHDIAEDDRPAVPHGVGQQAVSGRAPGEPGHLSSVPYITSRHERVPIYQCCGTVPIWYGSGSDF